MGSNDGVFNPESEVPLAPFTTLGVGGLARWFVRATSVGDVEAAHAWADERHLPLFVLGGGSNVLIADEGVHGLVVQIAVKGMAWVDGPDHATVCAGAGESWDELVAAATARGLAGVECLSGIPGSVGGTPIQNVGAYGQEVAGAIAEVTAFDRRTARAVTVPGQACKFGYRTSRFRREDAGRFIVCDVTFSLRPGPPTLTYPDVAREMHEQGVGSPTLDQVRRAVLSIRGRKGMVLDPVDPNTRSVGSFFVNPVVPGSAHASIVASAGGAAPGYAVEGGGMKVPAAWLIEQAGFTRGYGDGRVGLSSKHPLAIINRGGATARDVLRLAARIKRGVFDRFGVALRPEPVFVGLDDDADAVYLHEEHG